MSLVAAPGRAPTEARAVPHLFGGAVELTWTNPPVAAFDGGFLTATRVVRRERSYPTGPEDGDVVYDGTGQPVIDRLTDTGLTPLTRYYYTVFAFDGTEHHTGESARASALATADYGMSERLYRLLPAVHQRDDVPLRPDEVRLLDPGVQEALRVLPPELRGAGQLRRFLTAATAPVALMRSTAEALRQLHDIDRAPPDYLPLLAEFLNWRPDRTLPVYSQRNEVRAAPTLYRTVGTVPNLRTIVTRYTGWQVRVAEYAQHINRSNQAPQGNLFALRETGAGWLAADDAADLLGFAPPNTGAGLPGVTGTAPGPFPLRPGMELTVSTDGEGPVTARFTRDDALDLAAATTAEVAAALNRQFRDLTATALPDGHLRLDAHGTTLRVEAAETSLVSLDGAPRGRLAIVSDPDGGFGVFHTVSDPLGPADDRAARRAVAGMAFPRPPVPGELGVGVASPNESHYLPAEPVGRIQYKRYRGGRWGDSVELFPGGEPAAAALPPAGPGQPQRILLCWVDRPGTPSARVHSAIGTPRPASPATLTGVRGTPFPVPHGSYLMLRDAAGRGHAAQFARTDFADPAAPSLAEVMAVVNDRLGGLAVASSAPGGALRLESPGTGGDARLQIDLAHSSAATALGFGTANHIATGDFGDRVDWTPAAPVPGLAPGRYSDLAAVGDGVGAVLAYARHDGGAWQVRTVRFDGATWSGDEPLTTGNGVSSREPTLGRDPDGRIWAVWSRQDGHAQPGWSLRQRNRPVAGPWSAETALTTTPPAGTAGDREPAITTRPGLPPRVFFRSDRTGGADLWAIPIGGTAAEVTAGAPGETWPAPVTVAGRQWLLHRSDRSVAHSHAGTGRATDTGTLRRYAGSTSVVLRDLDRLRRLQAWDDLVSYTPHRPAGELTGRPLADNEVYTRGTVGLYLTQPVSGLLDEQMADRLRAVLRRFLPINVRAVVWLAPRADVEYVYTAAADLIDTFTDVHPDIDRLGALSDASAVLLPGWGVLGSAVLSTPPPPDPAATGVTADPADLTSLRWRTQHPPPQ
ncbi:phage tail protein [Phytomonospora sp. NPDC050363]|uniref:phage tail protein n=1 Tax=Phytomonospora sp. NPDC050363 TaxID=3155642 RepID=UPI0033F34E4E